MTLLLMVRIVPHNNPIESIYTGTMYCFDTMSKVCIVLFQMKQKFDDVVIFLTLSQRNHGFTLAR